MSSANAYPFLREIRSPLTDDQLVPLDPRCRCVQFAAPLGENEHERLARFLRDFPEVPLRAYAHPFEPMPNLLFLRHYPSLRNFRVDVYHLESTNGVECLPSTLEYFGLGQTKTKSISVSFLKRFRGLKGLFLENQHKGIEAVAELTQLEDLCLRSITLPDLSLLVSLKMLRSLDLKLGGTRNLNLLPRVGQLRYLELWMIKGLEDLTAIAEIPTLQNLYLQALKNVTKLPSFENLHGLRRVTIDTMKGLTDLAPVSHAPRLEELFVFSMNQLGANDFRPFLGHPSLRAACIGLGNSLKNTQTKALLGLAEIDRYDSFVYK